ncbi:CYTH domain-containing protein [Bacillus niameyensis]|uniref:CYTH domain-containing protein n=1 Tax=Bacillus niameyensis TaxID=1522308 RepID=UPI0007802483|nr:CYTH domain-containing protein [Bacillus niameyensis]
MAKTTEIEFKNLLTKKEFNLLLRTFNVSSHHFFTQVNHYFDTKDFKFKKMNSALRIRELPNSFEMTLKRAGHRGSLEINQQLEKSEVDAILINPYIPDGEIKNAIHELGLKDIELGYFGSLTTHRAEVEYKNGQLVFDHSLYLDQEDYEVEYEAANWNEGSTIFRQFLEIYKIEVKMTDTKIGRMYKAKMKKQKDEEM